MLQLKLSLHKAVVNHYHGHLLSLSVKDVTNSSRLLGYVMGTMAGITTLVKYSPKREQLLESIQENIEFEDNDDSQFDEQFELLAKSCITRWTIRATAIKKVIVNYQPLYNLWQTCLEEKLDRETHSRIIGCQSQMGDFRFFHGLNLAHTVYSITDNLSKTLQKEKLSAVEEKSVAMKTVQTFKNMRNEQSAGLFLAKVSKKASHLILSKSRSCQENEEILITKQ